MASWKKIVTEDSANHIAQTSALADHLNATGAGDRSFTASPEVLFQDAASETGSLAKGTSDQWLRMNNAANALVWDTLDVVGDSGTASASTAGLAIQTENALQITTAASGNTITIGMPDNVTIDGDLTVTGNNVVFGNGEMIDNVTDTKIKITAATTEVTGDLQVTGNDIKSSSGTPLSLSGDNVTVNGNLIVSGDQTIVNTEIIPLDDNAIVLNGNASGTASEDAGLVIERGDDANTALFWDESNTLGSGGGRWAVGAATESGSAGATTFSATPYGYLATVNVGTSIPGSNVNGDGIGSFVIDTDDANGQIYVRMS